MKNESSSEPINTLLISHYLCKTAFENRVVIETKNRNERVPFITDAIFFQSIIKYYSIFPNKGKRRQFVEKLKKYKPEDVDACSERITKYKPEDDNDFETIFNLFLQLRDKNIAHRDNKRIEETQEYRICSGVHSPEIEEEETFLLFSPSRNEIVWPKVPNKPPSRNKTKDKSYINKITYIKTNPMLIGFFLDLIKATIKIYHSKEQPPLPPL